MLNIYIFVNLIVFHGIFPALCFWMTVILGACTADLGYQGAFHVMTQQQLAQLHLKTHVLSRNILAANMCVY